MQTRPFTKTSLAVFAVAAMTGGFIATQLSSPRAIAQVTSPAASQRIATVDTLAVVERLVLSDRYKPARDKLTEDKNAALKVMRESIANLEQRAQGLAQDSPELRALAQQYTQLSDNLQAEEQKAVAEQDAFNAQQIAEAYRLVTEAAAKLGTDRGYSHVVQTRTGEVTFRSRGVAGTIQEILARNVIASPAADDLTQTLIDQFGVANVNIDAPVAPPATAQPVAPAAPVTTEPAKPQ
ncbi:MAG TPA: OmpH family outer membrane protein [Phycisphaerales bacterium]|nr:OmpH family outer membrane protein [Phycisphaerales bacterium]